MSEPNRKTFEVLGGNDIRYQKVDEVIYNLCLLDTMCSFNTNHLTKITNLFDKTKDNPKEFY
ncbi:MAG: hypothetical protein DHS20C18_33960 [Saprospiraceae bacterium]|nr:MAG: hypothetical protein DHS20C18_33960 [Saprospiraceae bacterium]